MVENNVSDKNLKNKISFADKFVRDIFLQKISTVVDEFDEEIYEISKQEVDDFIKYLRKDKYFQKSTHNTYAYRIKLENGTILEWKNDDWETWAWMCVLRELQRKNAVNLCLVVTRYFWWIYLQTDRFKNVIDCCQEFFKKIE